MLEKDSDADRLVAALLLRDARSQADVAQEEGVSAYLGGSRQAPHIDARVLQGEVAQARSHNRVLHGVHPLPRLAAAPGGRDAAALDLEFVRRAHELREAAARGAGQADARPPSAEERPGAGGFLLGRGAEERPGAGGPLLGRGVERRPNAREAPPCASKRQRTSGGGAGGASGLAASSSIASEGRATRRQAAAPAAAPAPEKSKPWLSRGLRVRVVDLEGDLRACHLGKGVVRRVADGGRAADVELESSRTVLQDVAEALLETVVSKDCHQVEIVRGPDSGMIAELIERDPKGNVAVIRLSRGFGKAELRMKLDDVCEFS